MIVVAKLPKHWKLLISATVLLKSIGPSAYYMGNVNYVLLVNENHAWTLRYCLFERMCVTSGGG